MNTLIKQFLGTASINLFSRGLALISGIIYARFLGPEQYGLYGFVISILALLTIPVIAGLPNLIVREVANFHLDKEWGYIAGIISWSRCYVLLISFLVILLTSIGLYFELFNTSISSMLFLGLFLIPLRGFLTQQGAVLNGFRKPVLAQTPLGVLAPLMTLGSLIICLLNDVHLTGVVLIKITIVASICAFILSACYLRLVVLKEVKKEKSKFKVFNWHKSLAPFTLMAIVGTLNTELASVFLGWLDTVESVAFFKVAMQGTALISLGLSSINTVIMPQVARCYKSGDLNKTQILLSRSVRLSCFISFPILITLVFFGEDIIGFLFGESYVYAYSLLVVLCIGQSVNVLMGSVGVVLYMTNNENYALKTLMISLLVLNILLFILIPTYSAIGAAVSVSIGLVLWNVLMAIDVYKLTGLKTWLIIGR